MSIRRIDNRTAKEVWHWFDRAFEGQDYPNVSWAIGSDWGFSLGCMSPDKYKNTAISLMINMYGPRPLSWEHVAT